MSKLEATKVIVCIRTVMDGLQNMWIQHSGLVSYRSASWAQSIPTLRIFVRSLLHHHCFPSATLECVLSAQTEKSPAKCHCLLKMGNCSTNFTLTSSELKCGMLHILHVKRKKITFQANKTNKKWFYFVGCLEAVLKMESMFRVAAFIKQMILQAISCVTVKQGQSLVFTIRTTIHQHFRRIIGVRHYLQKEQTNRIVMLWLRLLCHKNQWES